MVITAGNIQQRQAAKGKQVTGTAANFMFKSKRSGQKDALTKQLQESKRKQGMGLSKSLEKYSLQAPAETGASKEEEEP